MYDGIATLIAYGEPTYDEERNEILPRIERTVFVQPRGVYQAEFYNAAQLGLKPSLTLEIAYKGDYHDEKVVEYEGREYSVVRVDWSAQRDKISLICEERVSNG